MINLDITDEDLKPFLRELLRGKKAEDLLNIPGVLACLIEEYYKEILDHQILMSDFSIQELIEENEDLKADLEEWQTEGEKGCEKVLETFGGVSHGPSIVSELLRVINKLERANDQSPS